MSGRYCIDCRHFRDLGPLYRQYNYAEHRHWCLHPTYECSVVTGAQQGAPCVDARVLGPCGGSAKLWEPRLADLPALDREEAPTLTRDQIDAWERDQYGETLREMLIGWVARLQNDRYSARDHIYGEMERQIEAMTTPSNAP